MIVSIGSLLANRCHGNMIRVRQNKFTHFDGDLAKGKTREQMPSRFFGECFDQSIIPLNDELFQRRRDFGIVHCVSDIIPGPGPFRPEGHIQRQPLRLRAFRIGHTDARLNSELFDMNPVDHAGRDWMSDFEIIVL
ncbi:MAG TPA: hypothetical protein VJ278_04580 [Chthoniobacterales bacterium]|nr:hypothetical protein [Chthoniobacterales bacterium]